jgi:UDP-glucose 4-epimerase
MPYIAQVASGELEQLSVYGNDYPTADGSGVRDFIHVMDLAEGHLAALMYLETLTGWDAINLGTGEGYSVMQMLNAFELASNKVIRFRIDSRRPGDIAKCYADIRKASEKIGWQARFSIDEMCQSTWKWTVSHNSKR